MQTIPEWLGITIILAPLLLFVIIVLSVHFMLTRQKVKLANLLAETEVVKQQQKIAHEEAENKNITTNTSSDADFDSKNKSPYLKRSSSRLVLLISTFTALALGACITSFYFYMNIFVPPGANKMNLFDFNYILLLAGIGVVPYAFNQLKKIRL